MTCEHGPSDWETGRDGCTYCCQCDSLVCEFCGRLFREHGGAEHGPASYEPTCNCYWQEHESGVLDAA